MDALTLIPFAARVFWRAPQPLTVANWQTLLADLLDELGRLCAPLGVIGHIKGLALLPGGGYLHGSKVSANYPADISCSPDTAASPSAELKLDLNVLVYGLAPADAQRVVEQAGRAIATRHAAAFELHAVDACPTHQHHEYDGGQADR